MENCKLCNQERTPDNKCKAHILPRSFYKYFYPEDFNNGTIYSTDKNLETKRRAPQGIYDGSILCKKCDGEIGKYDKYFLYFLKTYKSKVIAMPYKKPMRAICKFNQQKLKMFLLSYLYRASITSRPEFSTFKLKSADEQKIADIIRSGGKKSTSYTIYCVKISKENTGLMFCPQKINGARGRKHRYMAHIPNNMSFIVTPRFMRKSKWKANGSLCSYRQAFLMGETEDFYMSKYFDHDMIPKRAKLVGWDEIE